jgi:hypothetical protein
MIHLGVELEDTAIEKALIQQDFVWEFVREFEWVFLWEFKRVIWGN